MLNSKWIENNKYFIILVFIGLLFILIYSWLFIGIEPKFTSPDETANYHFIKLFAEENELRFTEPLNEIFNGLIKPRSMGFVDGHTVPGSFLGMIIIYGLLSKIFGTGIILFLTPFFSVVGVLFFFLLIKEIFKRNIAFISALLLFVLPPFWYYSSRGMFHNILFISLLIIGLYFFVRVLNRESQAKYQFLYYLLGGLFIGLALITRTSEIVWVGVVLVSLFVINRSRISWSNILVFFIVLILVFLPIFYFNNQLYGSPFSFAYSNEVVDVTSLETASESLLIKLKKLILPFGINFELIGRSTYQYLIVIFSWFSILLIIGLLWFIKNIILGWLEKFFPEVTNYFDGVSKHKKLYLAMYILVIIWLVIYYGSYQFFENIDKTEIILGSSYLRYWLPVYVFSLPIVVLGIIKISQLFKREQARKAIIVLLIITFCIFSANKTLADPLQGLYQVKKHISESVDKSKIITRITNSEAVIISGYADKVFFPERKVIVNLPSDKEKIKGVLTRLLNQVPVYYFYNPLDENSNQILNYLRNNNFQLKEVWNFSQDKEVLYQLQ